MGQILQNEDDLRAWVAQQRTHQPDGLLVTTNGCFDLLHVGHLRYLQWAQAQGQWLLIFVNTDASVQRLKGPSRPILPQQERLELLAGLGCVDAVMLFDTPTADEAIRLARPDVHVKGEQYAAETLPEKDALEAVGARLALAPMVPGRSTSSLIDRILQANREDTLPRQGGLPLEEPIDKPRQPCG
jgi:D-beta-D-heptose 7-phosphate kinase/D-beta-D-heptose 1-phosphate adenosyltransferase